MSNPHEAIFQAVERLRGKIHGPIVVALDGGSGAGKLTIAERLIQLTEVALIPLDNFYQTQIPESDWPHKTVTERLNGVFDWDRIRIEAIEPLRNGETGDGKPLISSVD